MLRDVQREAERCVGRGKEMKRDEERERLDSYTLSIYILGVPIKRYCYFTATFFGTPCIKNIIDSCMSRKLSLVLALISSLVLSLSGYLGKMTNFYQFVLRSFKNINPVPNY